MEKELSKVPTAMVQDLRIARSTVTKLSTADKFGDRRLSRIAVLKAASALKVGSGPREVSRRSWRQDVRDGPQWTVEDRCKAGQGRHGPIRPLLFGQTSEPRKSS